MGAGILAQGARPLLGGETLPLVVNPTLLHALERVEDLHTTILNDAARNGEELDVDDSSFRLYEGGMRALEVGSLADDSTMSAFRLLASAAHYWNAQYDLRTKVLPREDCVPRVKVASLFNKRIRTYADLEPQTQRRELIDVMAHVRDVVGELACRERYEPIFRNVVRGARYERWGKCVVGCAGVVEGSGEADDLMGRDLFWRVHKKKNLWLPVDIASSKRVVQDKCNLRRPAVWGIRGGVLVLWPGLTELEMGDTFETDEDVAEMAYSRELDGTTIRDILKEAKEDRRIRKIVWEKD